MGGAATGWPLPEHLAYVLAGLDLAALALVTMGRRGLQTSGSVEHSAVTAGEALVETCRLAKQSIWPAAWLEVEWADGASESLALLGGRTVTATHEYVFPRRGRYLAGGGRVIARDPLGLISRTAGVLPTRLVTVYPRPIPAPEAVETVRMLSAREYRRRLGAADGTVGALRDYVEGDAPSRIHWRTSARRGVLTVSDPESARRRAVWLLVDLGGGDESADLAAGIAAYLARALHGRGRPIGAIAAGAEVVVAEARAGRDGPGHVLLALAETPAAPDLQVDRLVDSAARIPDPGCFVVVSAAHSGRDSLIRRLKTLRPRAELAVIVPDRVAA